jgi:hypothetical protein
MSGGALCTLLANDGPKPRRYIRSTYTSELNVLSFDAYMYEIHDDTLTLTSNMARNSDYVILVGIEASAEVSKITIGETDYPIIYTSSEKTPYKLDINAVIQSVLAHELRRTVRIQFKENITTTINIYILDVYVHDRYHCRMVDIFRNTPDVWNINHYIRSKDISPQPNIQDGTIFGESVINHNIKDIQISDIIHVPAISNSVSFSRSIILDAITVVNPTSSSSLNIIVDDKILWEIEWELLVLLCDVEYYGHSRYKVIIHPDLLTFDGCINARDRIIINMDNLVSVDIKYADVGPIGKTHHTCNMINRYVRYVKNINIGGILLGMFIPKNTKNIVATAGGLKIIDLDERKLHMSSMPTIENMYRRHIRELYKLPLPYDIIYMIANMLPFNKIEWCPIQWGRKWNDTDIFTYINMDRAHDNKINIDTTGTVYIMTQVNI